MKFFKVKFSDPFIDHLSQRETKQPSAIFDLTHGPGSDRRKNDIPRFKNKLRNFSIFQSP
jgi:hypothetical protein